MEREWQIASLSLFRGLLAVASRCIRTQGVLQTVQPRSRLARHGSARREDHPAESTLAELFIVIQRFMALFYQETGLVTHSFSSVDIAMSYWLDGVQKGFRARPATHLMDTRVPSPGINRPVREDNHSPHRTEHNKSFYNTR
jgi:hypothetical protein